MRNVSRSLCIRLYIYICMYVREGHYIGGWIRLFSLYYIYISTWHVKIAKWLNGTLMLGKIFLWNRDVWWWHVPTKIIGGNLSCVCVCIFFFSYSCMSLLWRFHLISFDCFIVVRHCTQLLEKPFFFFFKFCKTYKQVKKESFKDIHIRH